MDYNDIYEKFLDLCGYDYTELPQTDELRYRLINNGVGLYNSKAKKYPDVLQGGIKCDNSTETINKYLNGSLSVGNIAPLNPVRFTSSGI